MIMESRSRLVLSEYADATCRYAKAAMGIHGVYSVYTFGTVSAPGVSDIDFLVVFREPPSLADSRALLGLPKRIGVRGSRTDGSGTVPFL